MADYQLRGIPADLHRRVRIGTIARGTSIREVLLQALIRFDREFTEDPSVKHKESAEDYAEKADHYHDDAVTTGAGGSTKGGGQT